MVSGRPGAGKTKCAVEIEKYFRETQKRKTKLINEEGLNVNKNVGYKDNFNEKNTRSSIKAEAERYLTEDVLVIVDSLNYIKGFRYELYCIARTVRTPHCVVFCDISDETRKNWNFSSDNKSENKFESESLFKDLSQRFETPNPKNRWDSPLFTVTESCPDLPFEDMNKALFEKEAKTVNIATIPAVVSETNFVHELDQTTQEIVSYLKTSQYQVGDSLTVPKSTAQVKMVKKVGVPELNRIRRQFIKLSQTNPPDDASQIGNVFVEYLNSNLNL